MRHTKPIAIALGIIVTVIASSPFFDTGASRSQNQKIAADLLELHRQWDANTNIPALYTSLTNLPFHHGGAIIANGCVSRRYNLLGVKLEEYYFVVPPNEGTLFHEWIWYSPRRGRVALSMRQLPTRIGAGG